MLAAMTKTGAPSIKLYFAPRSRSFTALWLLEELGVPYEIERFDIASGRHKQPDYLQLNPMGKVPLVVDDGVPVAETAAIAIHLSDRHRQTVLSPAIDDPDRAAFLRWTVFAPGVIEPAFAEKFANATPRPSNHAWGSFDQMLEVASAGVTPGPFLLGDRFSAADVVVGASLRFGLLFGIVPKEGAIAAYVARLSSREAFQRALAIEEGKT